MGLDIHAGKRVLYKESNGGSNWHIGEIDLQPAIVNNKGVWFAIIPQEFLGKPVNEIGYVHLAELNQIFTDAIKLEDWMKNSLITKEEYIKIVQSDDFEKSLENAWVSDGEYYYYPISKYTENWIMKQPFNYVLRGA